MTNTEFVAKLKEILKLNTLYVNGCFGAPMTEANKKRYVNNTAYNRRPERTKLINMASATTYGFDCIGLIKGVLWGFKADGTTYGGAIYASNHVPDLSENALINLCKPSTDFTKLQEPGCVVWMSGHIGVYIGHNLVIECSPKWSDGVQITACLNKDLMPGYNGRRWTKWGKLPYITYEEDTEMVEEKNILFNGTKTKVHVIQKDGSNYIKLAEIDSILGLASVSYDASQKLPVVDPK